MADNWENSDNGQDLLNVWGQLRETYAPDVAGYINDLQTYASRPLGG